MSMTVNGTLYRHLVEQGIRNLSLHVKEVNELNVFPVPDGDTGTNMVTTLQNGFAAIGDKTSLPEVCRAFGRAVVFGARGNSGVILSQFFGGASSVLAEAESGEADSLCLLRALRCGVCEAYRAVSHPTEGTVLTVLRESIEDTSQQYPAGGELPEIFCYLVERARVSLENTPDLLPVLKEAGVVDSGGVGIVYVFEGMYKYLVGEPIAAAEEAHTPDHVVDYNRFHENSSFEYGYCTEFLLQLIAGREPFSFERFLTTLNAMGDSVAAMQEESKVKVHVHTATPERVMAEAHRYGEFLTLKIENMSVQHTVRAEEALVKESKITVRPQNRAKVGVVVCAPDKKTRDLFHRMGADAVIRFPTGAPTTKDFMEAARAIETREVVLFPNYKNNVLSAETAAGMLSSEGIETRVVASRSVAECYAALAMADLEAADAESFAADAADATRYLRVTTVSRAVKDATIDGVTVREGDYLAMDAAGVVASDAELDSLIRCATEHYASAEEDEPDTVTVFTGKNAPSDAAERISSYVSDRFTFAESDVVETDSDLFELIVAFDFS